MNLSPHRRSVKRPQFFLDMNLSPVPSPKKGRGTKWQVCLFLPGAPLLLRRGDRGEVQEQQGIISNIHEIVNPTKTL